MDSESTGKNRLRLDELLVRRGLFASRSRARDAVNRGAVSLAGHPVRKPGMTVAATADLTVNDPARAYVSRSALKLAAALDHFALDPAGAVALDLGASTGGFTQVLLERGAAQVFAIDVGHGQLAPALRDDPRVTAIEGLNARDLGAGHLNGQSPGFVVADVSFISLTLALPPALDLAAPGAKGVFLVKPQFEAGRDAIGKGGLLKATREAPRLAARMAEWLGGRLGWRSLGVIASPIEGGDGNAEYLLAGMKGP